MDNRITKNRILRHLEYDWFKYLLLIALSVFVWYMVFMEINHSRTFERVEVFFACYDDGSENLGGGFKDWLYSHGDTVTREVNVTYRSPADNAYGEFYVASSTTADVFIIPKESLAVNPLAFLELTDDILEYVPESLRDNEDLYYAYNEDDQAGEYFREEFVERKFGIRVDNLSKIDVDNPPFLFDLTKAEGYTEEQIEALPSEFYLVLSRSSIKTGEHGPKAKYHDLTQSLKFITYFLETYGA